MGSIASEWTCTSSKCYRGYTKKSWQEAVDFCLSLGPISTATGEKTPSLLFEDENVYKHVMHLESLLWINLNDIQAEGHYVDGTGAVPNTTSKIFFFFFYFYFLHKERFTIVRYVDNAITKLKVIQSFGKFENWVDSDSLQF